MGWAAAKGVLQRQATGWVVVVVGSSRSGGGGRRGGLAAPVHTRRAWTARESGTTWYAERRKRRAGGGSPVLFAVETNARFGSAAAVTRAVTSFACGWWLEHRSTGAEEEAGARGLWARQAARERYVLEKAATWDQAGERAAAISVGGVRLGSRSELPDQPTGTMCLTGQRSTSVTVAEKTVRGEPKLKLCCGRVWVGIYVLRSSDCGTAGHMQGDTCHTQPCRSTPQTPPALSPLGCTAACRIGLANGMAADAIVGRSTKDSVCRSTRGQTMRLDVGETPKRAAKPRSPPSRTNVPPVSTPDGACSVPTNPESVENATVPGGAAAWRRRQATSWRHDPMRPLVAASSSGGNWHLLHVAALAEADAFADAQRRSMAHTSPLLLPVATVWASSCTSAVRCCCAPRSCSATTADEARLTAIAERVRVSQSITHPSVVDAARVKGLTATRSVAVPSLFRSSATDAAGAGASSSTASRSRVIMPAWVATAAMTDASAPSPKSAAGSGTTLWMRLASPRTTSAGCRKPAGPVSERSGTKSSAPSSTLNTAIAVAEAASSKLRPSKAKARGV